MMRVTCENLVLGETELVCSKLDQSIMGWPLRYHKHLVYGSH